MTDNNIEIHIRSFFDENFEALRLEAGHSLSPEVKETALQQVMLYWRRLNDIASKVTDTEVRLHLPGQTSPGGRKFGIEGVVDIVRENDRTVMYDIKTHNAETIQGNIESYEKQLNVYAYIWQQLQGQPLDNTAVISTSYPDIIREALTSGDTARLEYELPRWNPLIEIPFSPTSVDETIQDFGLIVDAIEDGKFAAPPISKLFSKAPGSRMNFAVSVCRNCDARFSCEAYRAFALGSQSTSEQYIRAYFSDIGTETQRDDWVISALDVAPGVDELGDLS